MTEDESLLNAAMEKAFATAVKAGRATAQAEIERLRHHLENMIDIAVEHMPENRPSIPHDYEPYEQDLADIAAARAELQPKEGGR